MSQIKEPKFYNKNGDLTPYAFACGYIQWASLTGKEIDMWENGKKLFLDAGTTYHVKHYKNGKRISWESFQSIRAARKYYESLSI